MECRFTLKLVRDLIITYSKEIIQSILMKENITLFSNVKVIIHLNCIACVKVPIESVVKSLVLRYEKGLILDEMVVAENGPFLHHNDEILERTINQYWRVANMISDSK